MTSEFSDPPLQFRIMPLVMPNPNGDPVNKELIRQYCEQGLSECPTEDRCLAWLVLLGVYPSNASDWPEIRESLISSYFNFVKDYKLETWPTKYFTGTIRKRDLDVPDQGLMLSIYSDIFRSGRQFYFFPPEKPPDGAPDNNIGHFVVHMRRLERILYIFGALNPSLSYMQGFNELVSPLYFAMISARQMLDDDLDIVESLTFHCLQKLITGTAIQEFYMTMDNSSIIYYKMSLFQKVIDRHLPDVADILKFLDVHPLQYAYKCINLLFAQEHPMPTTLIIWDALFAHIEDLMNFAYYVEVARIAETAHLLSKSDFAGTITAVQNINVKNVYVVLKRANAMYLQDKNKTAAATTADEVFNSIKKAFTIRK